MTEFLYMVLPNKTFVALLVLVKFCRAFSEAEFIRMAAPNSISSPSLYTAALTGWGDFCIVK